ncbi:hypothetical protein Hanom_Chr05g00388881 [Helianthus anomalus]
MLILQAGFLMFCHFARLCLEHRLPYNKALVLEPAKWGDSFGLYLSILGVFLTASQDLLFRPLLEHTWGSFQGNGHNGLLTLSPKMISSFQTALLSPLHLQP